jgi:hypothetical protein
LILLVVDTLIVMVSQFYSACLLGAEALDEEGKIPIRKLIRSKIFKVFTLPYIQATIALPLTFYVLTQMVNDGPIIAAVYVTAIYISVHLSTFLGLYYFMRNSAAITVPWRSIAKYALTAAITGIALYLLPAPSTLLLTVAKTLLGLALYATLLLAIDAQARELVRLVYIEILEILRSFLPKKANSKNFGHKVESATEN